jgi:hypothetical protein
MDKVIEMLPETEKTVMFFTPEEIAEHTVKRDDTFESQRRRIYYVDG